MPGERHELLACDRVANARRLTEVGGHEPGRVGREGDDVSDAGPAPDAGNGCQHARGGKRVVKGLLGFREHRAVVPPGRLGGFDREQDAPLGIDSRFACADAASWRAVARRASSRAWLRRTSANAARADAAAASTANPASVARRLRARRRPTASAAARASARNSRSPAVRARSVAPAHASNCASRPSRGRYSGSRPASSPLSDRLDEPPVEEEVLATLLDPPAEPIPLGQDRLVRDLDRRRPRQRLAVEGEQAVLAVARDDLVERVGIELELAELASAHPASRVLRGGVGVDEAQEDLAACGLRRRTEARVELLRAAPESADDATGREVALERQRVAGAGREELGQRVLQERQGARLVADVGDDLGDEPRLEADADASCRPLDRLRKLVLRGCGDRDHPGPQELPELRVAERMVEEVGAQRDENARGRVRVVGERGKAREETAARLLVGRQREQLLELVDDEQQLAPGRQDPLHDATDPELVARELLDEVVRPLDCDPEERGGELLVRVRAREHVGDEPLLPIPATRLCAAPGRARP